MTLIKSKIFAVDWIGLLKESSCDKNFEIFCNKISTVMDSVSPEKNCKNLTQM